MTRRAVAAVLCRCVLRFCVCVCVFVVFYDQHALRIGHCGLSANVEPILCAQTAYNGHTTKHKYTIEARAYGSIKKTTPLHTHVLLIYARRAHPNSALRIQPPKAATAVIAVIK